MEEITISTKALVHLIGLLIGLAVTIAVYLTPREKEGVTLVVGWLLLLIYFLVMPESWLHEFIFK